MKKYNMPKWAKKIYENADEIRSVYYLVGYNEIYEEDLNMASQLVAEFMGWV